MYVHVKLRSTVLNQHMHAAVNNDQHNIILLSEVYDPDPYMCTYIYY